MLEKYFQLIFNLFLNIQIFQFFYSFLIINYRKSTIFKYHLRSYLFYSLKAIYYETIYVTYSFNSFPILFLAYR